jgi:hypothetical protein
VPTIHATFYDGFGDELARAGEEILLTVRDGREKTVVRQFFRGPKVGVKTDFTNSTQDHHVILASLKRHRDAGFMPVRVQEKDDTPVHLMLLPREARFAFASFAQVEHDHPELFALFDRCFNATAAAQFELLQNGPMRAPLACLLNIVEALAILPLAAGQQHTNLVDYIHSLEVKESLQWLRQDRFFAWVDPDIETAIKANGNVFRQAPDALHPGARISYKQFGFGEANVQITLHPEHQGQPGGQELIKAEFDIDYFRDDGAHLLLEVFPNMLKRFVFGSGSSQSLTDPVTAYGMRWIASKQAKPGQQLREFRPAFGIQPRA